MGEEYTMWMTTWINTKEMRFFKMKKQKQRLLSLVLALVMCVAMLPVVANNVEAAEVSTDSSTYVTCISSNSISITVKSSVDQYYYFTCIDGSSISASLTGTSSAIISIGGYTIGTYGKTYSVTVSEIGTHTVAIAGTRSGTTTCVIQIVDHAYEKQYIVEPTCIKEGYTVYTCSYCGNEHKDDYTPVNSDGHVEGKIVIENHIDSTCTEDGTYDNVIYCTECGKELSRETITIPATGHAEGETVVEKYVDPTCTKDGSYDEVIYCTECGEELSRETIIIPAIWHVEGTIATENYIEPTYIKDGSYDIVIYCAECGEEISRETVVIPATGGSPYTDVSSVQWFYEPVMWAYENSFMTGRTEDTFAPDDTMTRAEFVTVLYRMENCNADYTAQNDNPFTDVSSTQWFYNYVMWAYDNGIVNGTSDTTFDPDGAI
ncbi:MAG: S-layer homology domain-containing protein, partial [Firmicutes bacterium]|nr:S-layer homology domain-containing protein [Bacillota bacterium]